MNREIKFRAWVEGDREMLEEVDLCLIRNDKLTTMIPLRLEGVGYDSLSCRKLDNPILMQYTGLKDKNGKEIWEGDSPSRGNVVEFSNGSFNINGDTPLAAIHSEIEILGNIYEHAQLLK